MVVEEFHDQKIIYHLNIDEEVNNILMHLSSLKTIKTNRVIKGTTLVGAFYIFSLAFYSYLFHTVGCIRNGIWDRKLKPNFKNNIMASSIAAVVMGILWFIISYRNYHKLVGSIATGVIMFFSIEILCFLALTLTSKIYKKRLKKLEDDSEDE